MKKLKGISWFEQQADKMVLVLFALFLVAVLVMQTGLLGGQASLKVGGRDVPLDRAFEEVRALADRKRAALESEQVDPRIPATLPSVKDRFEAVMAGHHRPMPAFALGPPQILGDSAGGAAHGPIAPVDALLAEISIPAPIRPLAEVVEGTVDPIVVAESGEALARWLPKEQPFDIRAVSIESALDSAKLREMLSTAPEGRQPIPVSYWQNRLEVVDVEFIRQELGSDGQWGPEQVVEPLPGRSSLRDKLKSAAAEPSVVQGLLDDEAAHRQEIRRPDFLETVSGEPWLWPSRLAEQSGDAQKQNEVDRLMREYKQTDAEIRRIQDQLERLSGQGRKPTTPGDRPPANNKDKPGDKKNSGDKRNPPDNKDRKPGGGGGGGGGDRGLPREPSDPFAFGSPPAAGDDFVWPRFPWYYRAQLGGSGGGPKEDQGPSEEELRKQREQKQREQLQKNLKKHQERQKEIEKELEKNGVNVKGIRISQGAGDVLNEPLNAAADASLTKVTVWGHDLAVRPGGTYRYKARLYMTNPLGGRADALREEQKALAATAVLRSADSEWSDPVSVLPTTVYYVTAATQAGGGGIAASARATVELYEFYYGYWRRAVISAQPGDALTGTTELPELETFKIDRDADGHYSAGDRAPVARERTIAADAFLLDVAAAISGGQPATEVFLRTAKSIISMRRPAEDGLQNPARARIESSAALGKSAVLRVPGTRAPATPSQGSPADQSPKQPGMPEDRDQPRKPEDPSGPPSLPKGPSNF